jgi:HK97 family phage portal protein
VSLLTRIVRGVKISLKNPDPKKGWFNQLYNPSIKGVNVTEKTSLGLAAYWRCVNLITSSIATLPLKLYDGTSGKKQIFNTASEALKYPNTNITSFTYNEMLIGSALMHGNGYAYIERFNKSIELHPIHPDKVVPFMYDGEIFYEVKFEDEFRIIAKEEMIHLRGFGLDVLKGYSVLDYHKITIGLSLAAQRENANFYEKGTKIDGYLRLKGKLDDEAKKGIREGWSGVYGMNGSGNGTAVLDQETEYVRLGMPPADAKFIETSEYNDTQIATLFAVPAHMINKLDRATHTNIEHQAIEFVKYCLLPWIAKLEQEYNRKLLSNPAYYFKYSVNALMRGDAKTRAEFYRIMFNIGMMTQNEGRALEDLDPVEEGDKLYVPLNMIDSELAPEYYQSQLTTNNNG